MRASARVHCVFFKVISATFSALGATASSPLVRPRDQDGLSGKPDILTIGLTGAKTTARAGPPHRPREPAQQKRGKLRLVSQLNGEIATPGRLDLSPRRQQRESSVISSPLNVTQSLVDNVTNWVQFPPPARRARSDGRCLRIEILAVRDLPDKSLFGAQSPLVAVLMQPTGEQGGATEPARGAGCNATWGKTSKNVISLHLTHADTGIVLEVCPLARTHARTHAVDLT